MAITLDDLKGKALKGVMFNKERGLALSFMVNPRTFTVSKKPNYALEMLPGFNAPFISWKNNGATTINFDLVFDGTKEAKEFGLVLAQNPFDGVLGPISVLESFIHAENTLIDRIKGRDVPSPPPDMIFAYGFRWWRCVLNGAPITEILHNALLVPERMTVPIELLVTEDPKLAEIRARTRQALALKESSFGLLNSALGGF